MEIHLIELFERLDGADAVSGGQTAKRHVSFNSKLAFIRKKKVKRKVFARVFAPSGIIMII